MSDGRWFRAIYVGEDGKDRLTTLDLADGQYSLVRFVRDSRKLIEATKDESVSDHLDTEHFKGAWVVEAALEGDLKTDPQIDVAYDPKCDVLVVTEEDRTYQMHSAASSSFEVVTEADAKLPPVTPVGDKQRGRWTAAIVRQHVSQLVSRYDIYEFVIADDDTFEMTAYALLQNEDLTPLGLIRVFHNGGKVFSEDGQLEQKGGGGHNTPRNSVHYDAACDELLLSTPGDEGKTAVVHYVRPKNR